MKTAVVGDSVQSSGNGGAGFTDAAGAANDAMALAMPRVATSGGAWPAFSSQAPSAAKRSKAEEKRMEGDNQKLKRPRVQKTFPPVSADPNFV